MNDTTGIVWKATGELISAHDRVVAAYEFAASMRSARSVPVTARTAVGEG